MISAKAFQTNDEELLETYANNFIMDLNKEEIEYALSLFKGKSNGKN